MKLTLLRFVRPPIDAQCVFEQRWLLANAIDGIIRLDVVLSISNDLLMHTIILFYNEI